MNYTDMIRKYLNKRKGVFFEITYEVRTKFNMINPKSLMKILNRLEGTKLITKVGKGFYYINNDDEFTMDKLIDYYSSGYRGVLGGYCLLNQNKISNFKSNAVIIYTNHIGMNKTVGNAKLIKIDIPFLDIKHIMLIQLLSIFQIGINNIIECDLIQLHYVIDGLLCVYSDKMFEEIIKTMNFNTRCISTLDKFLKCMNIKNNCVDIFLNK